MIPSQAQLDNRDKDNRQEKNENRGSFKGKMDVGLNVTSVISSFSGNGNFLEPENLPFLLRFGKQANLRLGFGLRGTSSDFFDNITQSFRESSEQEFFAKLGFQQTVLEEGKWDLYAGLDVLGQFINNEVIIQNGQAINSTITKTTWGAGVSPLAGIKYYLSDRIYLSTEANFTFIYAQNRLTETTLTVISSGGSTSIFNGGSTTVTTSSETFSVAPPLFLYLNYKL